MLLVGPDEENSRLDRVLMRRFGEGKRTLILRLIRKGNVRLNRRRAKPETRVHAGDQIFLPLSLRSPEETLPARTRVPSWLESIEVLHEDDVLLAVNKPAGIVVHGGSGHQCGLIEAMREHRGLPELRLAHRLDRDTSGVLLMAKNLAALRLLAASFRERSIHKTYLALVAGHMYPHAGRMHSRLKKGAVRGGERMVVDHAGGKESVTDFQVVYEGCCRGWPFSLLALQPHSGRTHQLRVQLQREGHAILGDRKYADRSDLRQYRSLGGRGMMLHAWRLRLWHPLRQQPLEIRACLPASWKDWLSERLLDESASSCG